jgi:Chaperone of endosialidase
VHRNWSSTISSVAEPYQLDIKLPRSGALFTNTIGASNTAEGYQALYHNTGSNNIAVGSNAGVNLTTGSNNVDVGNGGVAGEAAKIRIGKVGTQNGTFVAGIRGVTVASAVAVVVDVNGHLGTVISSARFKEAIKPMDKASEAILALKPVTFRYKMELALLIVGHQLRRSLAHFQLLAHLLDLRCLLFSGW